MSTPYGNSAAYRIRKLQRDCPEAGGDNQLSLRRAGPIRPRLFLTPVRTYAIVGEIEI
jgi:hypothetical protein